jgi:hypothetical protein
MACIAYQAISLRKGKKKDIVKSSPPAPVKEVPSPQKVAAALLANARLALQHQHKQAFYHEVQQALWHVVEETYQVLPSKMNKHYIAQLLAEKGMPAETIQDFSAILDECEWALYTPGQSVNSMEVLISKAEGLLKDLLEIKG